MIFGLLREGDSTFRRGTERAAGKAGELQPLRALLLCEIQDKEIIVSAILPAQAGPAKQQDVLLERHNPAVLTEMSDILHLSWQLSRAEGVVSAILVA